MKTPYDTALRALQREVDEMRTAISEAANQLVEIESVRQLLSDTIQHEANLMALNWSLSADGYLARARIERERLAGERRAAEMRLDGLRRQAMESYGSLRVMEGAAEGWREQADRTAATAEQARSDDFAGARFARDLRNARTSLTRRAGIR